MAQQEHERLVDELFCPACQKVTEASKTKTVVETYSGIILGYMLLCQECGAVSFLKLLGVPPLFDLSGRYSTLSKNLGEM